MVGNAWTVIKLTARLSWRRLGILLAGNLLWLLASIPIVTWPAATGALFYLAHRVVREERALDPDYAQIHDFWVGFRRYWQKSTVLALLDVIAFAVLAVALVFYGGSNVETLRWLAGPVVLIALVWLGAQMYLFPILIVAPERSIAQIIRTAVFTTLTYPGYSLAILLTSIVLTAVCIVLAAGPVVVILFSLLALLQTMALRLIRVHRGEIEPSPSSPSD